MICSQMIANQNQAVMFLADIPSASTCSELHLTHAGNKLTCLYSIACGLFGPIQKLKSSAFNNIRTLFEKHPGCGIPALFSPLHSGAVSLKTHPAQLAIAKSFRIRFYAKCARNP